MEFTVHEAREYADKNQLLEWLTRYLTEVGGNPELATGIQIQQNAIKLVGPTLYPLRLMDRCSGPEKGIQFPESTEKWEKFVEMAQRRLRGGLNPPPLIITRKNAFGASISEVVHNSRYTILHGSYQHEALKRMGRTEYWAINCLGLKLS
jgi:hypothetical protein